MNSNRSIPQITHNLPLSALLAMVLPGSTCSADPLPSWNEGPAKQAIVEFVK